MSNCSSENSRPAAAKALASWGRVNGWRCAAAHSRRPTAESLASLVEAAVAAGRFVDVLQRWRAAELHAAAGRTILALGLRVEAPRAELVHRAAAQAVDREGARVATEELFARLFALGASLVGELLLEEGLSARYQGLDAERDLAANAREVLGLDLWPLTRRLAAYLARYPLGPGAALQERVVRHFEAERPVLALRLGKALHALRRSLREVVG